MKNKWKKISIVLAVFLFLSLLLNFVGGFFSFIFIDSTLKSLPRRISGFADSPVPSGVDIVMLGDSLTHEGLWSEHFPEYRILNRGISGDSTADIIKRLPQIYKLKPEAIFFMVGVNDVIQRVDFETTQSNYKIIFDGLGAHLPHTKIYIQSILPFGKDFIFPVQTQVFNRLNNTLKEEAARRRYTYINLWSEMTTRQGLLREEFTNDGAHLMGSGYLAWSRQLEPFLRRSRK